MLPREALHFIKSQLYCRVDVRIGCHFRKVYSALISTGKAEIWSSCANRSKPTSFTKVICIYWEVLPVGSCLSGYLSSQTTLLKQ
eukprot:c40697_g1_i1 orf=193-447(+)